MSYLKSGSTGPNISAISVIFGMPTGLVGGAERGSLGASDPGTGEDSARSFLLADECRAAGTVPS